MDKLIKDGAEAVILGCTEITMLIGENDIDCPIYNTTELHVRKAIELALCNNM
jgi:aspartate racemase